MTTLKTPGAALCAIAAAFALSACDRGNNERTAGERLDGAVANAEQKAAEVKAEAKEGAQDVRQGVDRAADAAGDKMKDASITTAINAELARDAELSALRINVDTADGRVTLRGTAPTPEARERATTLAARAQGVLSVDNQLVVKQG